jgi:putative hydrolase
MRDLLDLHTHTIASGHAYNTLYEMAHSAAEKGVRLYGCSEHAPAMPGTCHIYYFSNLKIVPRTLCGIPVMMGVELNITDFDGTVDLESSMLQKLDYAIASIHIQCIAEGTVSDYTRAYVKAIENPDIRIIGHPDDSRLPADYDTLAAAAKEHHKLLEVNNSSLSPVSARVGAWDNYQKMLERCAHYGTSIIINSDAHVEADVGNHQYAHELLASCHFPEELIVNTSFDRAAEYLPVLQKRLGTEPLLFKREEN